MSFAKVQKVAGKAPGYYNATESSWGGFPIKDAEGKWSLIHAQMANHCPLGSWTSNSIVARSVSTSGKPEGPYSFAEELLPPLQHSHLIKTYYRHKNKMAKVSAQSILFCRLR